MKKGLIIISIVVSVILTVSIAIVGLGAAVFIHSGSKTPSRAFERGVEVFIDQSLENPVRECVPYNEIAVLPMDDYMAMYIGYVRDKELESNVRVVFCPMKIMFGRYYPLRKDVAYGTISQFEDQDEGGYKDPLYSLKYTIVLANSSEIENFDPEIYSFVNTKYTDSKGVEQDVVFCYTYEINWEIGDRSDADRHFSLFLD